MFAVLPDSDIDTNRDPVKLLTFIAILGISLFTRAISAQSLPTSFAYILQADSLVKNKADVIKQLAACGRDWIVLDAAFSNDTSWERSDLEAIRQGQSGRKIIAYISIGEAEDYRPYWRKEWGMHGKLTAAAPPWLGAENREWKGNYRVKYWQPEWQKCILEAVDDAMTRDFDGIYLDIVDGFETFEQDGKEYVDNRVNPSTKQTFRRDMVDWVKTIAARARAKNPAALVIPQNGSQLLSHPDFLATLSAIGIEDLFTNGDKLQDTDHSSEVLGHLKKMDEAHKPVLLIEYSKSPERQSLSEKMAHENALVWLVTDRQLKTLGISGK